MQVGWPGLSRAIALTIMATSAFWIALGAWLFRTHVAADYAGGMSRTPSEHVAARAGGQSAARTTLAGLVGGEPAVTSRPAMTTGLAIPVVGVRAQELVDTFTQARAEGQRHHDAIDIMAPEGTPVRAAASGTVEKLFLSHDGGNTIYVRSPDRKWIFYYAHLSAYAPTLREGVAVRRGEPLGAVGHTGNANPEAPHLHFAIWRADPQAGWSQEATAINPYALLGGKPAPMRVAQSKTSD